MMRAFATGDGASAANAALRPDLKETLLRLAAVLDANGRPHDPKLLEEFMVLLPYCIFLGIEIFLESFKEEESFFCARRRRREDCADFYIF